MPNEILRVGDKVSLPVDSGTVAGTPVRIGNLNGVAITDRANASVQPVNQDGTLNPAYNQGGGNPDGNATVWLSGGFSVPVTTAAAIAAGAPIYWDPAGKKLTTTASTNAVWGVALAAGVNNSDGTYQTLVRVSN